MLSDVLRAGAVATLCGLEFLALLDLEVGFYDPRGLELHQTGNLQHDLYASQAEVVVDLVAQLLLGEFEGPDKLAGQGLGLQEARTVQEDLRDKG